MANLEAKAEVVEGLRAQFAAAPFVVLTNFKGITVKQVDKVRRGCESAGIRFQVVKNTMCVRAIRGSDKEGLSSYFQGNTAVIFSGPDPVATAKVVKAKLKENQKLTVRAGFFEGDVLDEKGVQAIAELPGREELLGMLLATMQEGPRQVLGVLQAPARDLVCLMNNYANKLEGGNTPA